MPSTRRQQLIDQLLTRTEKQDKGCWVWIGAKAHGYGHLRVGRQTMSAHRLAFELLIGPIPDGLEIDHLCRTPPCINPAHLEPVTQAENVRRWARAITQCPQGHPYDEANVYMQPAWGDPDKLPGRVCRECRRIKSRERYAKHKDRELERMRKWRLTQKANRDAATPTSNPAETQE